MYDSSAALLNGVFFYNCKLFGLCGRDEHHSFDASQIIIGTDDKGKYIQFMETKSKTFNGGLKQKNVEIVITILKQITFSNKKNEIATGHFSNQLLKMKQNTHSKHP